MIAPRPAVREPLAIRAHPLVFALVLFLASELMFFASLFAAYYDLRAIDGAAWPPPGTALDAGPATFATLLLALSSVTVYLAARQFDRGAARVRAWLLATALLGALFLVVAVRGWARANFSISTSAYGSMFFTMTGFHALHVLAGIVLLIGLTIGLRKPAFAADHRAGAEAIMFYWHFVFVVWVGLWATIYFVR
jgi:cytochrome c oxidase subunit III